MFFSWFPLFFMGGSLSSLINTVLTQTSSFLGNAFVGRPFSSYKQTWFSLLCLGKASLTVSELCWWTRASLQCPAQLEGSSGWNERHTGPHCLPPSSDGTQVLHNSTPLNLQAWLARGRRTSIKSCRLARPGSFRSAFVLIKLRLPSSGSIFPWSVILVLLQGTEQGIPSTPGHLESAPRADVPGICQQRKLKGSFEKSPKVFVLNGVMVRVWVSLKNCGTEILGTVMYQGHTCLPGMINVLLVSWAFPAFCDVFCFRKPGGSGNSG